MWRGVRIRRGEDKPCHRAIGSPCQREAFTTEAQRRGERRGERVRATFTRGNGAFGRAERASRGCLSPPLKLWAKGRFGLALLGRFRSQHSRAGLVRPDAPLALGEATRA